MANFDWTLFNSHAFDTAAVGDGMGMNSDVGVGMDFGGGTGVNFGSGTDLNFMAGTGMDFDAGSINFGADSRFSM